MKRFPKYIGYILCTSYAYIFLVKILNFLQIPVSCPILNQPRHHCNANTAPATRPTKYCDPNVLDRMVDVISLISGPEFLISYPLHRLLVNQRESVEK